MATGLIVSASRPHVIPPAETVGTTIGELCEQYLYSKKLLVDAGQVSQLVYDTHHRQACKRIEQHFGRKRLISTIKPLEFSQLRASFPSTWGPQSVGRTIQGIRSVFKYGYEMGLLDRPMLFGQDFKKPSARTYRRVRRLKGSQMFEADEIRSLLEAAPPIMRAMILLGVNAGFGNSDCGRLPLSALDLERGWVNFPRPKTEIDRRCPLWPETLQAVKRAILLRHKPAKPELNGLVFLTCRGAQWCDGRGSSSLGKLFNKVCRAAGVERKSCKFYGLRRSFETIAGDSIDQVAVDHIMGHVPHASDMAAVYRQRISEERLRVVTDTVRQWLFPDAAQNYFQQFQAKAAAIHAEWEGLEKIEPAAVLAMLDSLGLKQTELALGIGFNLQWVNAIVRSRAPLAPTTEVRFRAFVQQLALGEVPHSIGNEMQRPQFPTPAEVPLTEEAKEALSHVPLKFSDLKALADCLHELGITQAKLAEWWGYKYKFYRKMRYCGKAIPQAGAARLRKLFGIEPQPVAEFGKGVKA